MKKIIVVDNQVIVVENANVKEITPLQEGACTMPFFTGEDLVNLLDALNNRMAHCMSQFQRTQKFYRIDRDSEGNLTFYWLTEDGIPLHFSEPAYKAMESAVIKLSHEIVLIQDNPQAKWGIETIRGIFCDAEILQVAKAAAMSTCPRRVKDILIDLACQAMCDVAIRNRR